MDICIQRQYGRRRYKNVLKKRIAEDNLEFRVYNKSINSLELKR